MQEYRYSYNFVRIAPRKVRLITNFVKNLKPEEALIQLRYSPKNAAIPVYQLLKSAIKSCKDIDKVDIADLIIKSIVCDNGPTLKRRHFKSRGRATMIKKRTSHIILVLTTNPKSPVKNKKMVNIAKEVKNLDKKIKCTDKSSKNKDK